MNPENFIQDYELALASQDWDNVAPLIHDNACVTFSDGSVYRGIVLVAEAYQRNFALIKNEQYAISDIHWINVDEDVAVYLFKFNWKGIINGQEASGFGRGTAVIIFEDDQWKLIAEHLGPAKS